MNLSIVFLVYLFYFFDDDLIVYHFFPILPYDFLHNKHNIRLVINNFNILFNHKFYNFLKIFLYKSNKKVFYNYHNFFQKLHRQFFYIFHKECQKTILIHLTFYSKKQPIFIIFEFFHLLMKNFSNKSYKDIILLYVRKIPFFLSHSNNQDKFIIPLNNFHDVF